MKLTLAGHEYTADIPDLYRLTIGEARTIKRQAGMTIADWRFGLMTLRREDPDVIAGLVWLLRTRAGETPTWAELDDIDSQDVIEGLVFDDSDAGHVTAAEQAAGSPDGSAPAEEAASDADRVPPQEDSTTT